VTGIRRAPRSPAGAGRPESGPLRAPAGPSLSQGRGGANPVTHGNHALRAAQARIARLEVQVAELTAAGDYRGAFNASVAGLRAALAREARRRPADTAALYQYFTQQNVHLAREMPDYLAQEGNPR